MAEAPTAGGAAATPTVSGGTPELTAKRGDAKEPPGVRSIGRVRVSVAQGFVSFGGRGRLLCVSTPVLPIYSGCGLTRGAAVESWIAARARVAPSLSRRGSVILDEVAGVGAPSCDVLMVA